MRARRLFALALATAWVPAACHRAADDPAAAGADEQRQLNEAAAALDAPANAAGNAGEAP